MSACAKAALKKIAIAVILLFFAAPMLIVVVVSLSAKAHGAELLPSKAQACEEKCREVKKPLIKKKRLPPCATVEFTVVPQDEVLWVVSALKRLPSSYCWQLCDGRECSAPPSPCGDCDWATDGPQSVMPAGFVPQHSGRYVAHSAKQKLRFPREAMVDYIALCVTREGLGQSNAAVVLPATWGKNTMVRIPASGFPLWGLENVDQIVVPAASNR
jgi:hypothetical protein